MIPLRLILAGLLVVLTGHNVQADIVTYVINGEIGTATHSTLGVANNAAFTFEMQISDATPDSDASPLGGTFLGGLTKLTIPALGLIDAVLVDVTKLNVTDNGASESFAFQSSDFSEVIFALWTLGQNVIVDPNVFPFFGAGPIAPPNIASSNSPYDILGGTTVAFTGNRTISSVQFFTSGAGGGAQPVPEPSSLAMLGLVGVAGAIRRFRKRVVLG